MAEEQNPFTLPADEEIFLLREVERRQHHEEREKQKSLHVWEKGTSCSRMRNIRHVKDDEKPTAPPAAGAAAQQDSLALSGAKRGREGGPPQPKSAAAQKFLPMVPTGASFPREMRREKEDLRSFIAKKREMFLVQMSLDIKKAEILKLHEKAAMKEEALKKSQQMLEEDVTRFDAFLHANDAKAHKAMKQAESLMKIKQEKVQRIKQLKGQISAIQSEISKQREQKEECIKFKHFLDRLTPQEWVDEQICVKQDRKAKRKQRWIQMRLEEINRALAKDVEDIERDAEREWQQEEKKRKGKALEDARREIEDRADRRRKASRRKYPTAAELDKEYEDVSSGDELPLYFKEPKQLLDIFTALEEQNLFLIQNAQETEQALEEVDQKFAQTRKIMGGKAETLRANIVELEKQVNEERRHCDELKETLRQKSGSKEQDAVLKELAAKVSEVYLACGFDIDHDPDPLKMLEAIEAKLEELLAQLDECEGVNAELVRSLEREKEKERREAVRQHKIEMQHKKNEERLRASLKRSQEPIKKKKGKPVMFRSPPERRDNLRVTSVDTEALEREREYALFFT
ncbi:unnamed protein product [Vitrella brassicaformis CCMP3155]|uniref:DUF4200 domain-containing protein n=1 Tax=Vitrella brassicaformis (strain CCMP3155) TaxID=1169540 RepID=A0A0G4ESK6_VITBC|nr:unnamed protein product [Vitrella brassicaformis CCMP3155]|eukprot:CEM00850.1 unnamed protein product [Vitrella brassicaformis CCMP3155]